MKVLVAGVGLVLAIFGLVNAAKRFANAVEEA